MNRKRACDCIFVHYFRNSPTASAVVPGDWGSPNKRKRVGACKQIFQKIAFVIQIHCLHSWFVYTDALLAQYAFVYTNALLAQLRSIKRAVRAGHFYSRINATYSSNGSNPSVASFRNFIAYEPHSSNSLCVILFFMYLA